MHKEKEYPLEDPETATAEGKQLILHNDDVNTFDFVIESLVDVCEHLPEQAEQCALIAHYKGKCGVKNGDLDLLTRLSFEMTVRGLSTSID